jgi:3-aminobutyryl-CoA ammonia-lyase
MDQAAYQALIRVRMSAADAHYGGGLVDGAHLLSLFGDAATELLIRLDGDEGLFLRYDEVEFKAPVYAGDFIEARGWMTKTGDTSRTMEFEAYKVIAARPEVGDTAAEALPEPVLVARAKGVCVTPKELQRKKSPG